jgi:hypothetical protein
MSQGHPLNGQLFLVLKAHVTRYVELVELCINLRQNFFYFYAEQIVIDF